jgi:glycosyltransferase involved in cell wall biosynthesis
VTAGWNCVVLNYNNADILAESVPLLIADQLKIVLVDNGSDDGSREYIESQSGVLAICNEKNLGSSVGRNQGIDRCDGDLLLLDSDILYIPGSFAFLRSVSEQTGAACAGFHHYTYTRDKEKAWQDLCSRRINYLPSNFAYTHYGFFRRDVFEKCRFDESFGVGWGYEDDDLTYQMRQHGMACTCVRWRYYHRKKSSVSNLASRGHSARMAERRKYFCAKWGLENAYAQPQTRSAPAKTADP